MPRSGPDTHELASVEAKSSQRSSTLDDRQQLVDIDAGGREGDFEWQQEQDTVAASGVRLRERATRPLAPIDLLGVAVEADLHGANGQAGEPFGQSRVELLPVGLDLDLDPAAPSASATARK